MVNHRFKLKQIPPPSCHFYVQLKASCFNESLDERFIFMNKIDCFEYLLHQLEVSI